MNQEYVSRSPSVGKAYRVVKVHRILMGVGLNDLESVSVSLYYVVHRQTIDVQA